MPPLTLQDKLESIEAVKNLMKSLTGDRNTRYVKGGCVVTAKVGNSVVIDGETIPCDITVERDRVIVGMYWEEAGYDNYNELGLFGRMNSDFQRYTKSGSQGLDITCAAYSLSLRSISSE